MKKLKPIKAYFIFVYSYDKQCNTILDIKYYPVSEFIEECNNDTINLMDYFIGYAEIKEVTDHDSKRI